MDNLLFIYFGTHDYHFLIRKNIELLRRLYPNADVLVYDWGDENGRPSNSTFQSGVDVVSWSDRVSDTMELLDPLGADGLNELARAFKSRERVSVKRRFNKFLLKKFPGSGPARAILDRAMRYENLLLHKCYALGDCARRVGERHRRSTALAQPAVRRAPAADGAAKQAGPGHQAHIQPDS